MSAKSTDIKNLIKSRINNLGVAQAIYGYEELNPSGFPACFVIDTSLDGVFIENTKNRRRYAFNVGVMMDIGQDYEGQGSTPRVEFVENTLSNVIDSIINDLDQNFELDGATVLWVDAADYQRGQYITERGTMKAVVVTIIVNTDFSV